MKRWRKEFLERTLKKDVLGARGRDRRCKDTHTGVKIVK